MNARIEKKNSNEYKIKTNKKLEYLQGISHKK